VGVPHTIRHLPEVRNLQQLKCRLPESAGTDGALRPLETLLDTSQVARRLGVAQITLRKWRLTGCGPRFVRCGRSIRYRTADIEQWVSRRTVASTSEVTQ